MIVDCSDQIFKANHTNVMKCQCVCDQEGGSQFCPCKLRAYTRYWKGGKEEYCRRVKATFGSTTQGLRIAC